MKRLLLLLLFVSSFAFAQPNINIPEPYKVCDDNSDGFAAFDLNIITPTLITEAGTEISYFLSLIDAQTVTDPINLVLPFVNTIPFDQTIYIRAIDVADPNNPAFTTLNLLVSQKPNVNFSYTSACIGNDLLFTTTVNVAGDYSYSYSTPQGTVNPGNVASFSAFSEGYYSVNVIDNATGCISNLASVYAYFNPTPFATVTSTSICDGNPAVVSTTVNSGNALSYFWYVPIGANNPGNVSSFSTSIPGLYSVWVTDTLLGCTSNETAVMVNVQTTTVPTFTISPSVCSNFNLPTVSDNGISGIWSPTVQNTGDYTFTPNPGQCATNFTTLLTVESGLNANQAPNLTQTSNTSFAVFDLISQNTLINSDTNAQFKYFPSYADALNSTNEIVNPSSYTNINNPQTIGVRVFNLISGNCDGLTSFNLEVNNINNVYIPDSSFKDKLIALGVDTNFDNEIQFTEASAFTNEMNVSYSAIANLTGIEAFTNITTLRCNNNSLTSLNLDNLINLVTLDCSYNQIATLSIGNLINLKALYCNNNLLTSLNFVNLTQIEDLNCNYNQLTSLDVNQFANLKSLKCSSNFIISLNLNNVPNLEHLEYAYNFSNSLLLSNLPNLKYLDCSINYNLSSSNFNVFPLLEHLDCRYNNLSAIDVAGLSNLNYLDCSANQLTSLNVVGLNYLAILYANNNSINATDLTNLPSLATLNINFNQLTNLDLTGCNILTNLNCSYNQLASLNITGLTQLSNFNCQNNQLTALNFTGLTALLIAQCDNNLLTSLDFSTATSLYALSCSFNNLYSINVKNGNPFLEPLNYYSWSQNPSLTFICADEGELSLLEVILLQSTNINIDNLVYNSYCSFEPGGNYNTITGQIKLDANNNGCDGNDMPRPFIKVKIANAISTGATFTDAEGNYKFYTQAGTFQIVPEIENSVFAFSPTSTTFTFPDNNYNTANYDFCMGANGIISDIEVILQPVSAARPGFDATYKIVYKNKGNTTLSDSINFQFDDNKVQFVSSTPSPSSVQASNYLTWDYNNLLPFQEQTIYITLHVNATTDPNPVNIGDVLNFLTFSIPLGTNDPTPEDNGYVQLQQTVVDANITNEITCLEGNFVSATQIGEYLHYVIRFENTGSYLAENVILKNIMDDSKYDISSLQVLSSSHPLYTKVSENLVEFIFKNINLQSTSGNPPVGGHGDVLFKIKTKETLSDTDTVIQSARIFFDFKQPVQTNDAETTFGTLNSQVFEKDNAVKVYPNPTTSIVNIESDFNIQSIELYDVQGRVLETILATKTISRLDISSQASGIYFLKIKTDKGSKVEKVVKE